MADPQRSLSEYLSGVQEIIQLTVDESVWVRAEIRNLNIKGGHYYLELAEKEQQSDKVIASCRATIWKFSAANIVLKFERESGIELSKDLNVLIKVKARFDPQYGFSVNIEDIDSSFTLGDIARQYQQLVERLTQEGLIERNRQLVTPFDIQHVLVIAPQQAAGLGDFKKDADVLQKYCVCNFIYQTATFQGQTAPKSIIEALRSALKHWANDFNYPPDLIVIIRGGGAVNDLAYLNDYELAALLCKRSVPVWVGIGHEKDRTILDEIAHRSFDTPSKVIAGIRNTISENVQQVQNTFQRIKTLSQYQLTVYQSQNDQYMRLIRTLSHSQLSESAKTLDVLKDVVYYCAQQQVRQTKQHIDSLLKEILLQNPRHILNKGYAIVRHNGKAIRSVQQLNVIQNIQLELQDGTIQAEIVKGSQNE